jgi:XTP/dITP diphosphohydrolase
MRASSRIVLASMNFDKFREMKALLAKYPGIELLSPEGLLRNADKIGAVETHETYLENASAKARLVNQGCHYPALADDSGLELTALGGKPGVRSARFSAVPGYPSKIAQDRANIEKVLEEMKGQSSREARFVCTLALVIEGVLIHATGTMDGKISDAPRGQMGFGYDPIFIPRGENRTLGEMTETEKNAISHRAIALENLMKEVGAHGIQFAKP